MHKAAMEQHHPAPAVALARSQLLPLVDVRTTRGPQKSVPPSIEVPSIFAPRRGLGPRPKVRRPALAGLPPMATAVSRLLHVSSLAPVDSVFGVVVVREHRRACGARNTEILV